ncbi:hypothetical protein P175DRAFT_0498588 [Aspergillus ochraceoroseus IBT 24754]|uniref:Uncharacterized protein n=1 Tax=Aspergillus ochraceoroseus IBT 24754 TaxID=1392256 RepID=A0A2T5MAB0_9EURO|nr:uncharacterized protein P175DRAFT_0498588 [Aspergillus ochraceoroseus IBT 24754]PTU25482.1 hypothetical protein P175DRAFT_0498588 [Aspergillus ochraceoroseus IBT 24754]
MCLTIGRIRGAVAGVLVGLLVWMRRRHYKDYAPSISSIPKAHDNKVRIGISQLTDLVHRVK